MPTAEDLIRILKQLATVGPTNDETIQAVQRIESKLARHNEEPTLPPGSWRPSKQADASHSALPGPEAR